MLFIIHKINFGKSPSLCLRPVKFKVVSCQNVYQSTWGMECAPERKLSTASFIDKVLLSPFPKPLKKKWKLNFTMCLILVDIVAQASTWITLNRTTLDCSQNNTNLSLPSSTILDRLVWIKSKKTGVTQYLQPQVRYLNGTFCRNFTINGRIKDE